MTYADAFNLRTTNVSFNNVADAIDGAISRVWGGTTAGSVNAYTCAPTVAWTAYDTGSLLTVIPHTTNTGASTITVSGLGGGAKTIRCCNRALVGGELGAGIPASMFWDGVSGFMHLVRPAGVWMSWTPAIEALDPMNVSGSTIQSAAYRSNGSDVDLEIFVNNITTTGTETNVITFVPPVLGINYTGSPVLNGYVTSTPGGFAQPFSQTLWYVYRPNLANWTIGAGQEFRMSGKFRLA